MIPRQRLVPKRTREEILRVLALAGIPLMWDSVMFGPVASGMWLAAARDILVDAYPGVEVYWRQDKVGLYPGIYSNIWRLGVRKSTGGTNAL
jgi:hypothetical protein